MGFLGVMQAVMAILDFGLSTTLNRELAVLSAGENRGREMGVLVSTISIICWSIGAVVCAGVLGGSSWIASSWLRAGSISQHVIEQCVAIGALSLFVAWPTGLYSGGLMGLQRHFAMNVVLIVCSILRYGGVIPVLYLAGRDVRAFFVWQLCVNALQTFLLLVLLRHYLGGVSGRAAFDVDVLRGRWKFAAGIGFIAILGVMLTQADKVVLSRILTLEMFGYYALASSIATALYRLINPIVSAVFPRFSELMARGDMPALSKLYHSGSQFLAVLLFPVMAMVMFFSWDIIRVWTRDPVVADNTSVVLQLLVAGTVLNGLACMPVALQWAGKWVSLHVAVSLVMVILLVPLLVVLSLRYGAIGGASVWLALNVAYVAAIPALTHRRFIPDALKAFYVKDLLPACCVSLVIAGAIKGLAAGAFTLGLVSLGVMYGAVLLGSVLVADDMRRRAFLATREMVALVRTLSVAGLKCRK